jgi:hypothetical protein
VALAGEGCDSLHGNNFGETHYPPTHHIEFGILWVVGWPEDDIDLMQHLLCPRGIGHNDL